jgi:small-conductance mechanosensitive channel
MIATLLQVSDSGSGSGSGASSAVNPAQVTGWDALGALGIALLAVPVGALAARIAKRMLHRIPGIPDSIVNDAARLVKWLVYLIAFAIAMTLLGVTVGWLSIVVIVILVMALLMVKPMVENIAAGMLMTMRPSFAVGDQIQTDEYRGIVTAIGSRTTILNTTGGVSIHIPNVEVADKVIEVYTAYDSRKSHVFFGVSFDADLDDLTTRLMPAIAAIDIVETDPVPSVRASGISGDTIMVKVDFWYPSSHTSDMAAMNPVVRAIQATLADMGITPRGAQIAVEEERLREESSQPSDVSDRSAADAPKPGAKKPKPATPSKGSS